MSDIILDILRRKVDARKVKHVSAAKGGEWHSPCPVCGGEDRFHVWPNQNGGETAQRAGVSGTWWCRACDQTGDVIEFLKFADGLEFAAACKELRIELAEPARRFRPLRQPKPVQQQWRPTEWKIPSEKWREQATKFALFAHGQIGGHAKILAYLAGRGLPLSAVERFRLGYLEGEDKTGTCLYRARAAFGLSDKKNADGTKTRSVLWIPRCLTIPLWQGDEVHRIRLRRRKDDLREGDDKYLLLEGSGQAPMVLPPAGITPDMAVWVVVEAELDAMAVHYACGGKIGVIAVLTNRGKPDAATHKLLSRSPQILVALDFDPPGKKGERPGYQGWQWWQRQYAQARRWPVPSGKDPGEAVAKGVDLAAWINAALPASLTFLPSGDSGDSGDLGVSDSGMCSSGELGEISLPEPVPTNRWQGARADTPLADAVYPEECRCTTKSLRKYYAGKRVDGGLLIPCPRTKIAWYWLYHKENCLHCAGNPLCIVDFLTSPQMLAPMEKDVIDE
jgi:hypothetical protein